MVSVIKQLHLHVSENAPLWKCTRVPIHITGNANVISCLTAVVENWTLRWKPLPGVQQLHYSHYCKLIMHEKMSSAGEQTQVPEFNWMCFIFSFLKKSSGCNICYKYRYFSIGRQGWVSLWYQRQHYWNIFLIIKSLQGDPKSIYC